MFDWRFVGRSAAYRRSCMGAYSPAMEKPNGGRARNRLWLVVLASFLLWFMVLCFCFSAPKVGSRRFASIGDDFLAGNSKESSSKSHGKSFYREETVIVEPVKDVNVGDVVVKQDGTHSRDGRFTNFSAPDYLLENCDPVKISGKEVQPTNQTNLAEKELKSVGLNSGEGVAVDLNSSEPVIPLRLPENRNASTATGTGKKDGGDIDSDHDPCSGRYIYVHDLPSRFNEDLLKNCQSLSNWTNMCMFIANMGLGPYLPGFKRGNSKSSWFATNQFLLEVIFHNRMKQYKCLTNDSSLASAIYVPYYAGLDVSRYLWSPTISMRDAASLDLVKWLRERPEWKKMWGRDHFMVAGRITWDFRRLGEQDSDWGNRLMFLPESRNMTMLVIESSPWNNNDFAIPYPTYFHPSTDNEVFLWQKSMRRQKRRNLFCFAGAPRPHLEDSIRAEIIEQCRASRKTCKLLECNDRGNRCYQPVYVMKMFQSSQFCLQPPGDSFTRRSAFDSILAGCIPVFFHPGSAYVQYPWHLPKDYTKYSVFIPAPEVKSGNASIEKILLRIPKEKVRAMRLEVIRQIPKVVYSNPKSRLDTLEDAFDITVKGVLERTERIRRDMRMGKNTSFAFAEEFSWKYNLVGSVGKHEWDPFFTRK